MLDSTSNVSVIYLVDNQASILACCEEPVVIKGKPHSLNSLRMGLNLSKLVKVRFLIIIAISGQEFPDLNRARTVLFTP